MFVATYTAARGIDIANLEMVISKDLPDVAETYIHRVTVPDTTELPFHFVLKTNV